MPHRSIPALFDAQMDVFWTQVILSAFDHSTSCVDRSNQSTGAETLERPARSAGLRSHSRTVTGSENANQGPDQKDRRRQHQPRTLVVAAQSFPRTVASAACRSTALADNGNAVGARRRWWPYFLVPIERSVEARRGGAVMEYRLQRGHKEWLLSCAVSLDTV